MSEDSRSRAHAVSRDDFGPSGFRWLTLKRIQYRDATNKYAFALVRHEMSLITPALGADTLKDSSGLRLWESAERRTRFGEVDGVAIIARVYTANADPQIILESQYRPTSDSYVIELPAGLVDDKETAAEAALRELKEETGYVGKVVEESPICYSDPGMTNANMQFVVVDIDGDSPDNANVQPELEDGEFIDVFLLPLAGLYDSLLEKRQSTGWDIDARLLMYAAALKHGVSSG